MHIRYNNTNKYWEYSNDMTTFFALEENNAFDGDRKFGSNLSADVDPSGSVIRHFTFDGNTKIIGQLSVGATAAGTANVVGAYAFHNRGIAGTDKRIASVIGWTDTAQDSGALSFWTMLAGSIAEKARIDKDGNFWINSLAASFDPNASSAVKRLAIDGGTLPVQISLGMTQSGTAHLVGTFNFFNRSITGAEKRVAFINCLTEGAISTARLDFFTTVAGTIFNRFRIMSGGTVIINMQGALATNAIVGHLGIPQCAGVPTGVPTSPGVLACYLLYDTTNNKLCVYNSVAGLWRGVVLA